MVAVPFDPQVTSTPATTATLTLNQGRVGTRAMEATVTAIGWRGLILDGQLANAWDDRTSDEALGACGSEDPVCVGGPAELDCEGCPDAGQESTTTHAWVAMTLPSGGEIRPLVSLNARPEGGATARFVHLFPADRQALEAYHATRSTLY